MKKAILYIRVSTDEQADKGYSLQHQEDRLRTYCQINNIEVVQLFREDYSAKTFQRPDFILLLDFLKKNKGAANLLLFLKWDRFSRNAGEAYEMISRLNKMGVEPQGIEQPLDLNIPENKLMLAFFLAAPEVENDRRALNVIAGMRRGKKEGQWLAMAPKGYKNIRNAENKPIIVPNDNAAIIKEAFEECALGLKNVVEVWQAANKKGLKCSKNNFWHILRNPVYHGKVLIPAYRSEPEMIVQGIHEPIISEQLFNDVQDVLDGRKRNVKLKNTKDEQLPLRGFLKCSQCGGNLTGSASKGNGGRYYYYHCKNGCKERFKANDANTAFEGVLKEIKLSGEQLETYKQILFDCYWKVEKEVEKSFSHVTEKINKNTERIKNAQRLLADQEISGEDYREMKTRYETEIRELERKKAEGTISYSNFKNRINATTPFLQNIDSYYTSADLTIKQQIISSTFPEKTIYSKNQLSNQNLSESIKLIIATVKDLQADKKKTGGVLNLQSNLVIPFGFEPKTYSLEGCRSIQLSYGTIRIFLF